MRPCVVCGEPFSPTSSGHVSCSRACQAEKKGSFEARFWARVNKKGPIAPGMKTPCWLWMGRLESNGYARIKLESSRKQESVHRLAWEFEHGEIPEGIHVLHRCDVRHCVRHLFSGTEKDNAQDMLRKGRANKARGARHGNAKLTEEQARSLLAEAVKMSQRELAQKYGVHPMHVHKIVTGKKWAHLQQ